MGWLITDWPCRQRQFFKGTFHEQRTEKWFDLKICKKPKKNKEPKTTRSILWLQNVILTVSGVLSRRPNFEHVGMQRFICIFTTIRICVLTELEIGINIE